MLTFTKPKSAKASEMQREMQREGQALLFASFRPSEAALTGEPWAASASMYRNILAWYLSASGLSSSAVAAYLDISVSRANALANNARHALFRSPWSIKMMSRAARSEGVSAEDLPRHLFHARRTEMHAAEHALAVCLPCDLHVVSGALRLGRMAYQANYAALEGGRCNCRLCQSADWDSSPYWEDAAVSVDGES